MMEDLNKKQIILLVILVTFVISISTSIITFSLLMEAPSTITQTVNRVVERTIEKVVPGTETVERVKEIKEVSVVIQEEAVLSVIDDTRNSIGVLKRTSGFLEEDLGPGVLIENGIVIALRTTNPLSGDYTFEISDKKILLTLKSDNAMFPIFSLNEKLDLKGLKVSTAPLSLGQTAVYVGGASAEKVLIGRISELKKNEEQIVSEAVVDMDIHDFVSRGVFVDLSGSIIGIKPNGENSVFVTSAILNKALESQVTSTNN